MSSSDYIPHHLFVSATRRPARGQRKPDRDLLDPVRLSDQAITVSLEILDFGRKMPFVAHPLRVLPLPADPSGCRIGA
jgi:hypothetical protein